MTKLIMKHADVLQALIKVIVHLVPFTCMGTLIYGLKSIRSRFEAMHVQSYMDFFVINQVIYKHCC